jgi:hypothetical protein
LKKFFMIFGLYLLFFVVPLSSRAHWNHDDSPSIQPGHLHTHASEASNTKTDQPCQLTLKLVDAETGEPIPGLIRITTPDGHLVDPTGLLNRADQTDADGYGPSAYSHFSSWWILDRERTFAVPGASLNIEAFQGQTSKMARVVVDLTGQDQASITVPLFFYSRPQKENWYAGNPHLHYKKASREEAERYTIQVPPADGLDVIFFSLLERIGRSENYVSNTYTREDLDSFEQQTGILFGYGEEYRHNFRKGEGFGHIMLLNLDKLFLPASFGEKLTGEPYDDWSLMATLVASRRRGGTNLWCHNKMGLESIPNWVHETVDAQLIFDTGSRAEYEPTFYRYMNIGLDVPFATGTDWFLQDMAMTWVKVKDELSLESWLGALAAGRSYISNGPQMKFSVDGKDIGESLHLKTSGPVRVKGTIESRVDFKVTEVLQNGEVIANAKAEPAGGIYRAVIDEDIQVDQSSWFVLRIPPFEGSYTKPEPLSPVFNEYGKPLFAHTSAIRVYVGDSWVFKPEVARELIDEMEQDRRTVIEKATFSSERQAREVLMVYDQAMEILGRRIEDQ